MSIICKRYDLFTNRTETIEQSLVDAYLKQQNTLLWIEVRLPVDGELDWLGQTFSLQPATMQSIQAKDGYPSFVWNEKYYVFTSTAMYFAEQHLIHDPVYIICSHNYIITVEYHPIGFLADVRRQWDSQETLKHPSLYFIFLMIDSITESYFEAAYVIRSKIDELSRVPIKPGQTDIAKNVQKLMDYLNEIDHLIYYSVHSLYGLLRKVKGHGSYPIKATGKDVMFLIRHYNWLDEQVKNDKNILTNQLHQLRAHQSDYLNTLINRLTVVTIILTTASVITGFYGINVGGLFPGINNPRGALLVLALIMLLAAVQFLLLRPLWKLKS